MSFDLRVTPSTLEVDYDKNMTELYRAITDQDWDRATKLCKTKPTQAATWVVRHFDEDGGDEQDIMWRFLPIHSACARQPPASFISALIHAYPDGARCVDDQGMYALHYACGNQGSRDVIRQLLVNCPEAAQIPDPRGMLPVHYLACWGPSSVAIMDMMLIAHRDMIDARDMDGNTPLDLAMEGQYPGKSEVINILRKWQDEGHVLENNSNSINSNSISKKSNKSSHGSSLHKRTTISHKSATATSSTPHKTSKASPSNRNSPYQNRQPQQEPEQQRSPSYHHPHHHQARSRSASHHRMAEEEKKEDTDSAYSLTSTIPSTRKSSSSKNRLVEMERDMLRLKMELVDKNDVINKKEKEVKDKEESEKQIAKSVQEWKDKCTELEQIVKAKEEEIEENKKAIEATKAEFEKRAESWAPMEVELTETKAMLASSLNECKGLQRTLGDLMEQHEQSQKKSIHLNDRLGTLEFSLESVKTEQQILEKNIRERRSSVKKTSKLRNQKLKELLELEESIKIDEEQLEACIQKQGRELDAISAVIKAARD